MEVPDEGCINGKKYLWGFIEDFEPIPNKTDRSEVKRKCRARSDKAYYLIAQTD